MARAGFQPERTLEVFNWRFNPKVPQPKIIDLATASFVDRGGNVLFIGPAGVGKSHLGQGLGHRAVRSGHETVFITAPRLFAELRAGRAATAPTSAGSRAAARPLLASAAVDHLRHHAHIIEIERPRWRDTEARAVA